MKSAIFMNDKKFDETEFNSEAAFENVVSENYKTLFGSNTIFFNLKSKQRHKNNKSDKSQL